MIMNYIIIPARIDSKRLPRKMLLEETGQPLVMHTYNNCFLLKDTGWVKDVFIATPDKCIVDECTDYGANVIHTKELTQCGTHCCMLAAEQELGPCNMINIQGDAPDVDVSAVIAAIEHINYNFECATLFYETVDDKTASNKDRIKMVTNDNNDVLYYSRLPVPCCAGVYKIHIGTYAFPYNIWKRLLKFYENKLKPYNHTEDLEQLLWLEKGFKSHCIKSRETYSIDTREDYDRYKKYFIGRERDHCDPNRSC